METILAVAGGLIDTVDLPVGQGTNQQGVVMISILERFGQHQTQAKKLEAEIAELKGVITHMDATIHPDRLGDLRKEEESLRRKLKTRRKELDVARSQCVEFPAITRVKRISSSDLFRGQLSLGDKAIFVVSLAGAIMIIKGLAVGLVLYLPLVFRFWRACCSSSEVV